ncbi:MAG: peptidoglycan hydrolase CwlO-like protein [Marivirga sp.]
MGTFVINYYLITDKATSMRKLFLSSLLFIFVASPFAYAQEENSTGPKSMEMQLEDMINNSETFQQFKVIPIVKMNSFKDILSDTLSNYQLIIDNMKREKNSVATQNDSLVKNVGKLKSQLTETQKLVDGIQLFGSTVTKTVYNFVLWGIVVGLLVILVVIYISFLNANRAAKQAKNDKVRVDQELEDLRKTANEKQVKVKRELQTALNKIDELSK